MTLQVTLFCLKGCRRCDQVASAFKHEQQSGRYAATLNLIRENSHTAAVPHFPTLALTNADGSLARRGTPNNNGLAFAAAPLIGAAAVRKGLRPFLQAHAAIRAP